MASLDQSGIGATLTLTETHIKISQFQCFGSRDRCHPRSAISADWTGALNSGTLKLFLNGTLVEEVFGGQQLREIYEALANG
jgi:hypothetical protein